MWRAIVVLLALVSGACAQPEAGYPPQYELNFMRSCEASGATLAVCTCTWGRISAEISRADFDAFEHMPAAQRSGSPLQSQIQGYALACAAQKPPAP